MPEPSPFGQPTGSWSPSEIYAPDPPQPSNFVPQSVGPASSLAESSPEHNPTEKSQPVDPTPDPTEHHDLQAKLYEEIENAISRAIGEELRRTREAAGWSRAQMVAQMPSGIGDRTLLSYEHGTRHMSVLRFLESCRVLGVPGPTLLAHALQRAQIELTNVVLQVNLRALINDRNDKFRPMVQWARNKLNKHPDGVVEVSPSSVEELADFVGYTYRELAKYLARFTPDITLTDAQEKAATSNQPGVK